MNDGETAHFAISYESGLSPADGRSVAQGLMNVVEGDLAVITGWFAGTDFTFSFRINVELHNASNGGSWTDPPDIESAFSFHPTVVITGVRAPTWATSEQGLDFVRYLLLSEVTEMYMASKDNGWYEHTTAFTRGDEGSKGEGLSRFLAHQFTLLEGITARYPEWDVVDAWLTSTNRPNYVEGSPDDNQPDIVTGGTTCFLYYLHDQLGYSIPAIIDAGGNTLAAVYRNLTSRTDAWQSFINVVNLHYPIGTSPNDMNGDNIFPVPNLQSVDTGVSVVAGLTAELYLTLDRATPVSVQVQLTSDDPVTLQVPASVTIPFGKQDDLVFVNALAGTTARTVTVHATYAGTTVSAPIRILPHAGELTGVVSAAGGAPIADAVVVIDGNTGMTSPSHVHVQLLTQADGSWTVPVIPPDSYTLDVTASGYVPLTTTVVVGAGAPITRQNLQLSLSHPFTVHGTVTDQNRAPLSGATVTLIEDGGNLRRLPTTTGRDGTYSLTQDPLYFTGSYTLVAELPGYTGADPTLPSIPNGATLTANIVLAALGTLTGLVTDADTANPVAGAQITAGAVTTTSDTAGRYTLQLAPGPTDVTVAAEGFEHPAAASVTVLSAGTVEMDLALPEASATVTGTVFDSDTAAADGTNMTVRNAFVRISGAGGVRAGADGTYTVRRVPAGQAQIVVTAQGYQTETDTAEIVAHETVTIDVYISSGHPNKHPHVAG